MKYNLPADPETCPRCYVGRIKKKTLTLATMVAGELLSVPQFPAWVCDVCHAYMYDPKAMANLNAILSPKSGMQPAKPTRKVNQKASASRSLSKKIGKSGSLPNS
jgi:YgiT-type zinc finger domain-containing protein